MIDATPDSDDLTIGGSTYVYGRQGELLRWAGAMLGCEFRDEWDARAIGHQRHGEIVAVTVFERFTGKAGAAGADCLVHIVSNGSRLWFTRDYARLCMAYAFDQAERSRLTGLVPASNADSVRFNRRFGFKEEGRVREGADDGGDLIVFGLLRRECRWLAPTLLPLV